MASLKNKVIYKSLIVLERAMANMYGKLQDDEKKYCLKEMLKKIESVDGDYLSLRRLPKKSTDLIGRKYASRLDLSQYAIIIRGLIFEEDDFTIETVKLYKKIFPGAVIIVCSWNRPEYDEAYGKIEEAGGRVVRLDEPENIGVTNINGQLKQIKEGLKAATEMKCSYALVTRSDHRIYYSYTIEYMKALMECFPAKKNNRFGQQERIITTACFQDRVFELPPFFMRDLFHFGRIEDLANFFDVPNTDLTKDDYITELKRSGKDRLSCQEESDLNYAPESLYVKTYIRNHFGDVESDYEVWWGIIKEIFLMISPKDIDLYVTKYDTKYIISAPQTRANGQVYETRNYDFRKFMNIYTDKIDIGNSKFDPDDEFSKYWCGYF